MFSILIFALLSPSSLVAGHKGGNVSISAFKTIVTIPTTVTAFVVPTWTNSTASPFAINSTTLATSIRHVFASTITANITTTTTTSVFARPSSIPNFGHSGSRSDSSLSSGKVNLFGKRGLAYNDAKYTKNFGGPNSSITWQYNWNSRPYAPNNVSFGMLNPYLKFLPQLWSLAEDLTAEWHIAATTAINDHKADALMAYNEPDLCKHGAGSACMLDIPAAVEGYKAMMSPYYKTNIKLGMPAVTNGETGIPWAKKFLELCTDCLIDFVPIHFYTDAGAPFDYFTGYVKNFTELVKPRKVWVTEFALNNPATDKESVEFLKKAMNWLDRNEDVERYAYFWAGPGSLCTKDGNLTELGKLYNE